MSMTTARPASQIVAARVAFAVDRFNEDVRDAEDVARSSEASGDPEDRFQAELAASRADDSRRQLIDALIAASIGAKSWRDLGEARWQETPSESFHRGGKTYRVVFDEGEASDSEGARLDVC